MSQPNMERALQLLAQKLAQAELNAAYLRPASRPPSSASAPWKKARSPRNRRVSP